MRSDGRSLARGLAHFLCLDSLGLGLGGGADFLGHGTFSPFARLLGPLAAGTLFFAGLFRSFAACLFLAFAGFGMFAACVLLAFACFGLFAACVLLALAGFAAGMLLALMGFGLFAAGVFLALAGFALLGLPALDGFAVFAELVESTFEVLADFLRLAVEFAGLLAQACTFEVFGGLVEVFDPFAMLADHGFNFARFGRGGGDSAAGERDGNDDRCLHSIQGKRLDCGTDPRLWKAGPSWE